VAGFAPKPNFERTFSAPTPLLTSQPTTQLFFCNCILQGAIDFAEAAVAELRSGINGGAGGCGLAGVRCIDGGVADASGDECLE